MKVLPALVSAVGITASGLASIGASAQATPTAHLYYHGTTSMASFSSWKVCQEHAVWARNFVTAHGGKMAPTDGSAAAKASWKCFPTAEGTWTYLTLYTAARPLMTGDRNPNRLGSDNLYVYSHRAERPMATTSAKQCTNDYTKMTTAIVNSASLRLLPSASCTTLAGNVRAYEVDYLGLNGRGGLYGDKAYRQDGRTTSVLNEASQLGYVTPTN